MFSIGKPFCVHVKNKSQAKIIQELFFKKNIFWITGRKNVDTGFINIYKKDSVIHYDGSVLSHCDKKYFLDQKFQVFNFEEGKKHLEIKFKDKKEIILI